jgi:GNAT superfamily N-acetyltransferase
MQPELRNAGHGTKLLTKANQQPRRKRTGYETATFGKTHAPRDGESTLDEIESARSEGLVELLVFPSKRSVPYYRRQGFEPDDGLHIDLEPYVV